MATVPLLQTLDTVNGGSRVRQHDALKQTDAERACGIEIVNPAFGAYDFRRYGAVDDGVTDNTSLVVAVFTALAHVSGTFYACENLFFDLTTVLASLPKMATLKDRSLINAWNTSGFHQKTIGDYDGADATAVNDFQRVIVGSGHNASCGLSNRGTAGSSSGNARVCSFYWWNGQLTKVVGQKGLRDLARWEWANLQSTSKWFWAMRRGAPWVARNWEYWYSGVSYTSGDYVRTSVGFYHATTTGTSGATEPTHTTGAVSDGGVTWQVDIPNVDSTIVCWDEYGQIATNSGPIDGVVANFKSDPYSPAGGTALVLITATGSNKNAGIRMFASDGAGVVYPVPIFEAQSGIGLRLFKSDSTAEYARASDTGGLQLAAHGRLEVTATNGDTTPTVASTGRLILSNTGSTSITALDNSLPTQEVELFFTNGNTTLVHNASTFVLKGATNVNPAANSIMVMTKYTGSAAWFEKSRNF